MIVCVDVDYRASGAVAACVGIRSWPDAIPCYESVLRSSEEAAPYIPSMLFLREMPLILGILEPMTDVELLVVDGYVWLAKNRPGLGARLFEHQAGRFPVVGVAKRAFFGNDCAVQVLRGRSTRPLYVTAVGIDAAHAAECVVQMAGNNRLPTILKRADSLARGTGSMDG